MASEGPGGASVRVLLLADTHWPRRARELPEPVWAEVDRCDVVVHAGDWVDVRLLDALEERSRRLVACWGNNDGAALRARLPEVARVTLGGVRVAVVHETGPAAGRERRADEAYGSDTDLLVFGHSHIPWDSTTPSGLRLLNPGSPTDRRRQPHATFMTARVGADVPGRAEVTLHPLPRRT
ncbi:metallophosphoesterase [Actinotalea sp. Marseille-Q4924]|uniref:metallophosphoesterase family protein n=1 Tax=Actinotalea sp. Marseille-Q4924 TaxID=2866571 RepID=UPI001CE477AF|nr:metallophosphoesterase [Actinotalea sp. Marseille-Q4924]